MDTDKLHSLSRRERQIMDVIYSQGKATAIEVRDNIPDAPSMNAVRRMISILEEKGLLRHTCEGMRYIYFPVIRRGEAIRSAIEHLKNTFFYGSASQAMVSFFDHSKSELTDTELDELNMLIEEAKKQGR